MENNDIYIKAEELAAEMTYVNVRSKNIKELPAITKEGKENDAAVRKTLSERGIVPETKPSQKDAKNGKKGDTIIGTIKQWIKRNIIPFLKNKIVIISVIYIMFYSLWEDVIEKSLVNLLFSHCDSNIANDVIFYILAALLIICVFITEPKRKKKREHILKGIVSTGFWAYYRFFSDRFNFESFASFDFFKYIDIVALYGVLEFIRFFLNPKNKIAFNNDGFERDMPIENADEDKFNRKIFVQDSVNKILNTDTSKGAFSFGIVSPWGTGKSSFMNFMKKDITNNHMNECIVIEFNPWLYAHNSNLITLFFDELSKNIKPFDSTLSSDFVDYSKILSSIGTPETKLASTIVDLISPQSKLGDKISAINDSIKKIGKKIVIFVDDIDRLDSTEIMEVLKLIRNISNFPHMYFIVAYDKEYLLNCIKDKTHDKELDYAEKVFQIEFVLPQIDKTTIKNAIYESTTKFLTEEEKEEFEQFVYHNDSTFDKKSIINDNITNIRDVRRIVNSFKSSYSKLKGEIDVKDLFVLEILKNKYPTVYALLNKDRSRVLKQNSHNCYELATRNELEDNNWAFLFSNAALYSIIEYINDNDAKLHLKESDKGKISDLLHQLFPSNTINTSKKSINNIFHTDRYFSISILDSDLSDVEFDEILQKDEESIKTKFKEWAVNRSGALAAKLKQLPISDNKGEQKRYVRMLLFALSIIPFDFYYITEQINKLKEFNDNKQFSDEDKSFIKKTLCENGYSERLALYLYNIEDDGMWNYPLSRTELNEIRQTIFEDCLKQNDDNRNNVFKGYQYTKDVYLNNEGNRTAYPLPYNKNLMKEYAKRHIQELIIFTIIKEQPNKYKVNPWMASQLWDTWDNFIKYLNTIKKDNPIINEYLEFVEKCKEKNFEVLIDFPFKQINLNAYG